MVLALNFILTTGILLNIIALISLINLKQKILSHYILMCFWLLIFSVFIAFYGNFNNLTKLEFFAHYLQDGVRFLIPPLILLYIKSIFSNKANILKANIHHFIPFVLYFVLYTFPKSIELDFSYINSIDKYINWAFIKDIYGITYFLFSLKLFYKVKKTMRHNYSNIKENDFLWIEKFLISFLLVLIIDFLITINEMWFGYDVYWDGYITVFFIIVAMSYLGYYGIIQSKVFLPDFLIQKHITKYDELNKKLSYLNKAEREELLVKFNKCMIDDKLYLLSDLNLKIMAEKMEVSERKLSAFFKEALKSNFYDTVNSFRVKEAKSILKSNLIENYSVTGIGLTCGFSSKSSFFRIFKNDTGVSPSIYRKMNIKQSHSKE